VAINGQHQWLLKAHRIFALTEWHKQNLIREHNLCSEHIVVTRNGIDLNRFKENKNRNKFKVVNSSSPDRGWPALLQCWPEIKRRVPEAELHLFYGFNNWEVIAKNNPEQQRIIQSYKDSVNDLKDQGVFFKGRVSQKELSEEILSSGVWLYATRFQETSCISAMEMQASGLEIVTSSVAALNETVGERGILIDGDCDDPVYREKFINAAVKSMMEPNEDNRAKRMEYAECHFGLDQLAQEWELKFNELIELIAINPVIPYEPSQGYAK